MNKPAARLPAILRFFFFAATLSGAVFAQSPAQGGEKKPAAPEPKRIVFFGDSITAGYGLNPTKEPAYTALLQQKLDTEKLSWTVVNAGLSGETSAGGLR